MSSWHGYILIESLPMTVAQRQTLFDALRALKRDARPQPAWVNHWRVRLDNKALILEAMWDEGQVTAQAIRAFLANAFGLQANQIAMTTGSNQYGQYATYAYGGIDRLRFGAFAGIDSAWDDSREACLAYLAANAAAWEAPI